MTVNSFFPIGTGGQFPDNGMLNNYSYDQRVTQNEMLAVGMKLMHHADAFYREEKLDGTGEYTWNPKFIELINQSFEEAKIANFSAKQRKLFDEYIQVLKDVGLATASEEIKALDAYLGGL